MGQPNANRIQFVPWEEVLTSGDLSVHSVAQTCLFRVGDSVTIYDVDANGCIISSLGSATVNAIEKDTALYLDASIDTSVATGTPYAYVTNIDDVQAALERVYCGEDPNSKCQVSESILAQSLDDPIVGQATYSVSSVGYFQAGDAVYVVADEGIQGTANVVSVAKNADDTNNYSAIVLDDSIDTSAVTNPKILADFDTCVLIDRIKSDVDAIDEPVENEDLDAGDCTHVAFETDSLFRQGSSKVFIDGVRKTLGTAGSRASHTQGTSNSQLTYTSMILGTAGNDTQVSVSAGAGTVVTVSGNFASGYTIDVTDNSGAATAADIAAAINADADAKRIVQVQYGGDGTGVVSTFGATSLTGGLDDGTGDYAELEQVLNNEISNTGYKWISFWILPNDRNRLNQPPRSDEDLVVDYRKILYNA
jgi:hypothetical protein